MAKVILVRPCEGLIVRDQMTGSILPLEGRLVEESIYWVRRAAAGDVTVEDYVPTPSVVSQPAPLTGSEGEE